MNEQKSITEHPDVQNTIIKITKLQKVKDLIYEKLDTRSHKEHKHYHSGCLFCDIEQIISLKNERMYFYHKMHGKIMPEEIMIPITKIKHTSKGIILS